MCARTVLSPHPNRLTRPPHRDTSFPDKGQHAGAKRTAADLVPAKLRPPDSGHGGATPTLAEAIARGAVPAAMDHRMQTQGWEAADNVTCAGCKSSKVRRDVVTPPCSSVCQARSGRVTREGATARHMVASLTLASSHLCPDPTPPLP